MDLNLDLNDVRIGVTLLSFVLFGLIVRWAWSRRNKAAFDEAQQLPFVDEAPVSAPVSAPPASYSKGPGHE